MTRTNPILVSIILMAGLTSACDQNSAMAEESAESSSETQGLDENATAPNEREAAKTAAEPSAVATVAPASEPAKATSVISLPLRPGQYVNSEAPCDNAGSWARVALVSQKGMNLNCTFKKIEKTGATTYRVTSECSDGGAAWGREEGVETSTDIYEIPNDTSFKVTYEGGSEVSARYCAQVSAG